MSKELGIPPEAPTNYTIHQQANEEGWKLSHDTYKHLTTLNTGSILLLVTFIEKIFTRPVLKFLIIVTFVSFLASILASFMVMNILANSVREMNVTEAEDRKNTVVVWIALSTFLIGILSLVIFAGANLYVGNKNNPSPSLEIRLTSEEIIRDLGLDLYKPDKLP